MGPDLFSGGSLVAMVIGLVMLWRVMRAVELIADSIKKIVENKSLSDR
jgi:uncharacterized membrane protein